MKGGWRMEDGMILLTLDGDICASQRLTSILTDEGKTNKFLDLLIMSSKRIIL